MTGERVSIGQITAPHGVKGEVRVYPLTDYPERFTKLHEVILAKPKGRDMPEVQIPKADIEWVKDLGKFIVVKFRGIDDRTAAEKLRSLYLQVNKEAAVKLPKNSYFITDIIGLEVVTTEGMVIGKITDVFSTGANDVYEITREGCKPAYIPAVKHVVKTVDINENRMTIDPIPGLID